MQLWTHMLTFYVIGLCISECSCECNCICICECSCERVCECSCIPTKNFIANTFVAAFPAAFPNAWVYVVGRWRESASKICDVGQCAQWERGGLKCENLAYVLHGWSLINHVMIRWPPCTPLCPLPDDTDCHKSIMHSPQIYTFDYPYLCAASAKNYLAL